MKQIFFVTLLLILLSCSDDDNEIMDPVIGRWALVEETIIENGVFINVIGNYDDCYLDDIFEFRQEPQLFSIYVESNGSICDDGVELYSYRGIPLTTNPEGEIAGLGLPAFVDTKIHPVLYDVSTGGNIIGPSTFFVQSVNEETLVLQSFTRRYCTEQICIRLLDFERLP